MLVRLSRSIETSDRQSEFLGGLFSTSIPGVFMFVLCSYEVIKPNSLEACKSYPEAQISNPD